MKISIAGASGYTGVELLRGLLAYREIEIVQITSRQYAGHKLKEIFPHFSSSKFSQLIFEEELDLESADIYFLCLPHEPSVELVKKIVEKGKKVIDLSAAYRIKNPQAYTDYYGFEHTYTDLLQRAVYGLPELFRDRIKDADIIANPGCYPTATTLALYPAVKEGVVEEMTITVNALSGISGAGRGLKQPFHYPEAFGNAYAYKPVKHRHIPEMEDVLRAVSGKEYRIRFTPHIIPVSRGMVSTVVFKTPLKKEHLIELYRLEYRYEPFIRFSSQPPQIKNVIGSNFCDIYVDRDDRTGDAIVITAIDNLGKGASLQALQNFNLIAGLPEDKYLKDLSESIVFP